MSIHVCVCIYIKMTPLKSLTKGNPQGSIIKWGWGGGGGRKREGDVNDFT